MNLDTLPAVAPQLDLGEYVLRPLERDDAPAWYAYLADPDVTHRTSYDIRSVAQVAAMIDDYRTGYTARRCLRWAIVPKIANVLIGTCGVYNWHALHASAELGYDLARAWWGRGVMTQAVGAVMQWSFTTLAVNRLQATVMVGNTASARVLRKHGFACERTLQEYKLCRGEPRDFWMFAHLRRRYRELQTIGERVT